jgi:hypothetical protein
MPAKLQCDRRFWTALSGRRRGVSPCSAPAKRRVDNFTAHGERRKFFAKADAGWRAAVEVKRDMEPRDEVR